LQKRAYGPTCFANFANFIYHAGILAADRCTFPDIDGLDPAIHALNAGPAFGANKGVDGPVKPGHDGVPRAKPIPVDFNRP
jgi:hypothetical protein